jgi:PEP-CTERM motif
MNHNRIFWKLGLLASALVTQSSYSFADTIVSVTDSATSTNRASLFLGGQYSNVVAVSWSQSQGTTFSNVTIDALLGSLDPSFLSGTAYLMRQIGPGTTSASEVVAPVDFTAPFASGSGPLPSTMLFSGLLLGPGAYYLVLSAPVGNQTDGSPLNWALPTVPAYTSGCNGGIGCNSVFLGTSFDANTTLFPADPFPPASHFVPSDEPMYAVTGTFVPAVPEPTTLSLFALGLVGLAMRRKAVAALHTP